ncbi:MAG: nodulation protein NodH [Paracoccaceae bacterium]
MGRTFKYFVMLADMRTGSNFLEASLNEFGDLHCYGELFNPNFVGQHNKDALFGVNLVQREAEPLELITRIQNRTEGIPGFRFFNDHDERVLNYCLNDDNCAKIVLSRNPLESYVSWKIAVQTGQWKLADTRKRRTARIDFDLDEFTAFLSARQDFHKRIRKHLQTLGQTSFAIDYDDLGDVDILNGLGRFLGSEDQIKAPAKTLKKQNSTDLRSKVRNHEQMVRDLSSQDIFNLQGTQDFEPQRSPGVPGFVLSKEIPLIFIPVQAGPVRDVTNWMEKLGALETGFSQADLRKWRRARSGHRSFTVLSHPLTRAHAAFCSHILTPDDRFAVARRVLRNRYDVRVPQDGALSDYSRDDHKMAFQNFLEFLKENLSGNTSVRVDAVWASQTAILDGLGSVIAPDFIYREDELDEALPQLAERWDVSAPRFEKSAASFPFDLAEIYDDRLEKLCQAAYRRDYINFGFSNWVAP